MSTTRTISSLQNSHVKRWVSLRDARGIERFRQCLVFGKKIVQETLSRHPARCLELLHSAKTLRTSGQARVSLSIPVHVATYTLSPTCFNHVDIFGTGCPILVCTALPLPCADVETPPRGLELLCPLGDPANVGALLRTALAMGVNRVILLKESAHPYHPKSIRAASGSIFDVPLTQGPSVRDLPDPSGPFEAQGKLRAGPSRPFAAQGNLSAGPATWVTLHVEGEGMPGFQWPKDVRILVGEEGPGLPPCSSGKRLAIPMTESVESLNAVAAVSMALYAYRVQHPLLRRSDHVAEVAEP